MFKLGIGNDLGISYKWYGFGLKTSTVAGSQGAERRSSGRSVFKVRFKLTKYGLVKTDATWS